jgi:hypothetical protein
MLSKSGSLALHQQLNPHEMRMSSVLYRPLYKDQIFLHRREGFLEMPNSFFDFSHLFLFLFRPLIISDALHQPWVLDTCSTKVLLHFFSHCCPVPFGPRNYAHSWTRNIGHEEAAYVCDEHYETCCSLSIHYTPKLWMVHRPKCVWASPKFVSKTYESG